MKTLKIILAAAVLIFSFSKSHGQITLDTIIHPWNLIGYDFYPVHISDTETKYFFQDTLTNTFSLYNLDFSAFLTNVSVPEPFQPFVYNFEVIYITRSLFDCDTSNIEFAYTAIGSGSTGAYQSFYIMRTDGTQLFKLDSAIAPYCFGCLNGSQETKPIINTEEGAKLFLYYPSNTNNLHIYSLCGILPTDLDPINKNNQQIYLRLFPNPNSGLLNFNINLPSNMEEFYLVIINNNGVELKREKLNLIQHMYSIDLSNYGIGNYFYSLISKNKIYQSGKFILTK
jgi:hypothetical protein